MWVFVLKQGSLMSCCNCRVIPTVLGTKPESGNGHSAVLLNDDRILIIKWGSNFDDCIWFLEVSILNDHISGFLLKYFQGNEQN